MEIASLEIWIKAFLTVLTIGIWLWIIFSPVRKISKQIKELVRLLQWFADRRFRLDEENKKTGVPK